MDYTMKAGGQAVVGSGLRDIPATATQRASDAMAETLASLNGAIHELEHRLDNLRVRIRGAVPTPVNEAKGGDPNLPASFFGRMDMLLLAANTTTGRCHDALHEIEAFL